MSRRLEVYYHGKSVGILAETPDKLIAFQYSDEWLKTGFSISPFSLPLRGEVFIPQEKARDRFGGLFGVFADSLPDAWGQLLLARHLESLGINQSEISTLDRLAYVGSTGMGALEYYPSKESDFSISSAGLDYDIVAEECRMLLSSKLPGQFDVLYKLGASSGGTRPKILLREDGKEWIIKFPAKTDPDISGKREYDYSLCAKSCGIEMTQTQLIESSVCPGYFKTARFDRDGDRKIHNITFAGILEADFRAPSCDYRDFLKLTRVLTKDRLYEVEQMFKTMCFNIATHNVDDHTKNFAFLHTEDKGWHLAPAYDLTYSKTYWGEHTTSANGKGKEIARKDLIELGCEAGLPKERCQEYCDEILEKTKCLEKYFNGSERNKGIHLPFRESLGEFSEPKSVLMEKLRNEFFEQPKENRDKIKWNGKSLRIATFEDMYIAQCKKEGRTPDKKISEHFWGNCVGKNAYSPKYCDEKDRGSK